MIMIGSCILIVPIRFPDVGKLLSAFKIAAHRRGPIGRGMLNDSKDCGN
jgi:hypothetical protein